MQPALMLRDVVFGYTAARPVLSGLTAEFMAGSITALIGPNGAGKTTALRALLGTISPQSGQALVRGVPVRTIPGRSLAESLAYVPQRGEVAFAYTVRQVAQLGRYAADAPANAGFIDRVLSLVDLKDRADDPFGILSAGQQQRATLARALAQLGIDQADNASGTDLSGKSILLDEPTSAMDPAHALACMGLLRTLSRRGLCVVCVLHDLSSVVRHADRAVVMNASGRAAAAGPIASVLPGAETETVFAVRLHALIRPETPGVIRGLEPEAKS